MPLLQQLLDKLTGKAAGGAPDESIARDHRLARVSRKAGPDPMPPSVELVLDALEEECAQPLYDRSVYVSPPTGPAGA